MLKVGQSSPFFVRETAYSIEFFSHHSHSLRSLNETGLSNMNLAILCDGDSLETLVLQNVSFWQPAAEEASEKFISAVKLLFPLPNKETGLHRFSRLNCLTLWDVEVSETDDVGEEVAAATDLFDDEKRINLSFPSLKNLIISHLPVLPQGHLPVVFGKHLLNLRGTYLESLHLKNVDCGKDDAWPSFKEEQR